MFGDDIEDEELDHETASLFAPMTKKVQADNPSMHKQEPFSEVSITKIVIIYHHITDFNHT